MKKVLILLISMFLLACTCAVPSIVATPTSQIVFIPTDTSSVPQPTIDSASPAQTKVDLTDVRLVPAEGNLESQLVLHAAAAAALGQHMFVEFDASW